ncbi:MAG: cysteine--tRNA ligase, partial [Muribaculaceae bacterium]|nr:cysteine--tRNA ligase [Muribaculaceae bacterium]
VIRFFILQAHYRSTVDFSNEALQASEKALQKMLDISQRLYALKPAEKSDVELPDFEAKAAEAMDDDLNTPQVIAVLFEAGKIINSAADGNTHLSTQDIEKLKALFNKYLVDIMGIRVDNKGNAGKDADAYHGAVDLLMEVRSQAKADKNWAVSDLIRDRLAQLGFDVKDTKSGVEWTLR